MMTLSKIAKEAHVSVSTASKAFSGSTEVNEETRELVFRVAKEHGCFKKFYNAKYPKLAIAVIAPEFSSMYYARLLSLIQQNLKDCELCVSITNFLPDCEESLMDYYYKHSNVDGMILIDPRLEVFPALEMPVALLRGNKHPGDVPPVEHPSVFTDFGEALEEALCYLKEKGVDSVGFLGESRTANKEKLFGQLMEKVGLPSGDRYVVCSQSRVEEGGYRAMEDLLQRGAPPRAVICAYDYMAIGAIKSLVDHGFRVPEDVAILGMDDLPEARFLNPSLASVASSPEVRCRLVAEAILKRINGEQTENEIVIPAEFRLRRSFEIDS